MKTKRVLIVEDNDLNRKLFENLVGQVWSFESVINGRQAVIKATEAHFDLILMDIQMPELDGISAMREIRTLNGHTPPIVAITAYADDGDRESFLKQGFDEFITKPIRPREFLQILERLIEGDSPENSIPKSIEENPDKILDINIVNQLMKYNSPRIIKSVFEDFLKECDTLIQQAKVKQENKDLDGFSNTIHIIKGNSGTLGANRIFAQALEIEKLSKEKAIHSLSKKLENLENEIQIFRDFIKEEINFIP
ncbi:response regulator [Algoriphagus hitonicola]|uniref:CheY chemotaxis protein or a CheY-like REC (Receiver) domain n=1 Tax=Algoriphagus hitonicola TaxID=435880 RepID=A0A1I2TSW2_9BACT|nr:response regulator [Algoriphagus hitonicola]SFG67994.1 CheY chemotaxis protein or a CheY-like REC (receiver) domain [Algoriphagus hitonicola]